MSTSPMLSLILTQLHDLLQQTQAEVFFVGGCVRDLLMGRPLHDLDLVVSGDAIGLARRVARTLHAAFVLLDEQHGIARVVLRGGDIAPGSAIDFAQMRGPNLPADLAVRDLTINAMAMRPDAFYGFVQDPSDQPQVLDPLGGWADLQAAQLRVTSVQALYDDPLRTMRVVRFAGELGFGIEPETAQWIRQSAGLLPRVSWERIRDELTRLLACPHAAPYLPLLDSLSLLPHVLPEIESARQEPGMDHLWETVASLEWIAASLERPVEIGHDAPLWQPAARHALPNLSLYLPYTAKLQRYLHTLLAADRSRLVILKLAALLHHAIGSDQNRSSTARAVALRLRLSARETLALSTAVGFRSSAAGTPEGEASRRDVYRFYRDAGKIATGMLILSLADDLAIAGPNLDKKWWDERLRRASLILTLRYERAAEVIYPPRLVDGSELMEALALAPGPIIGDLLEGIRETQAAGEIHTRQEALAWARQALEQQGPSD